MKLAPAVRALGAVARNPELRRVELAFAGFNAAEWGVWIAMLVYAYDQGGATTAGIVAIVQLVPAAVVAPLAATLADRRPPSRVLAQGYLVQAGAMAATAAALLAGAPSPLPFALAAVAASAVTVTRPTQSALLPALARRPEELTAANAVSGWIESVSVVAGPAIAGVLLAAGGAGAVFAAMAGLGLGSALLMAPVRGPVPARPRTAESSAALIQVTAGLSALRERPEPRLLVATLSAQYVVIGAVDVLFVVLAVGVLDMGDSGAGYLNAAFGAGGVLGIIATASLVGRRLLVPPLLLGAAVWSAAFVVIGLSPSQAGAFGLLAAAGTGRSLFDVAGRTLLQRVAPPDVLARVFGVLESLTMAGLALGSLLAPALVALAGARAAFIAVGTVLPVLALVGSRQLRRIDRAADVPVVEIALLRSLPTMAALDAPELERLARGLTAQPVKPGEVVVREGEPGKLFFVVAEGEFEVVAGGTSVPPLGRGDGFGEIALLEDCPRTATVTARSDGLLYALDRGDFLSAVSANVESARQARRIVDERLLRAAPNTFAPTGRARP